MFNFSLYLFRFYSKENSEIGSPLQCSEVKTSIVLQIRKKFDVKEKFKKNIFLTVYFNYIIEKSSNRFC